MGRKIAVIIELDEEMAEELIPGAAPGEYVEKEFGWLEKSGISLDEWLITDYDDECEWARYINYLIDWAFEHSDSENKSISPLKFAEWKNKPRYTWKDIVCINGTFYAEEFEISGEMDDEMHYDISDFLCAVANKHGVYTDDVKTYIMDNIDFNPQQMPYGAEACGCYINGKPEWNQDCLD